MIGQLALVTASIFFGAAFYVSVAEHPARLKLDDSSALIQWGPAYRRGFAMQASLAVISGLLGLAAWRVDGSLLWIGGAIAILTNWPYTLMAIMPVNRTLEDTSPSAPTTQTRALLARWGHLHDGRTALGAIATLLYLAAALRLA